MKELRVVLEDPPENVLSGTDEEILQNVVNAIKGGTYSGVIYDPENNIRRGTFLFL